MPQPPAATTSCSWPAAPAACRGSRPTAYAWVRPRRSRTRSTSPTHTSVESAVSAVLAEHGRIDVAVANAGVVAYGRFEDVPAHVFEAVLRTNVLGVANLARSVLPVMRRQKAGSLVVVGSVIGHLAVPDMAAYVVSKWGVRALARQLRLETRDADGVRVAYVAPGGVDTPIYVQAANYGEAVGRPPMPVTTPEKVAARILAHADGGAIRSQVGLANDVMRFGFTTLPWVYDALVTPLFRVVAQDRTRRPAHGPGNVLESQRERQRTAGWAGLAARRHRPQPRRRWCGDPARDRDDAGTPSSSAPVRTGSSRPTGSSTPAGRCWCSRRSPTSAARCAATGSSTPTSCTTPSAPSTRWRRSRPRSGRSSSRSTACAGCTRPPSSVTRSPTAAGRCCTATATATAAGLDEASPGDGEAWLRLCAEWDHVGRPPRSAACSRRSRRCATASVCWPRCARWAGWGS